MNLRSHCGAPKSLNRYLKIVPQLFHDIEILRGSHNQLKDFLGHSNIHEEDKSICTPKKLHALIVPFIH